MTTMRSALNAVPTSEPDPDAVRVVRNMNSRISVDDQRTSQSRPCTCVHCKFGRNLLASKRSLAGDLADHVFGHLVSTELARDILTTFVIDGVVQVFEGYSETPSEPHSEYVQRALGQAFEGAAAHGCIRLYPGGTAPEKPSLSTDQEEEEEEEEIYSFRWRTFPRELFKGDKLVSFLNEITDRAFAAATAHLATAKLKVGHRLVASKDNGHAIPLIFIVNEKRVNFSAARLVSGSNKDLTAGLEELQWHNVHSHCSDWEHLALILWDGRGCIDFIRILLGLALADGVDLGQNPSIELGFGVRTFQRKHLPVPSDAVSSTSTADFDFYARAAARTTPRPRPLSPLPAIALQPLLARRHSRRDHSEIEEDDNEMIIDD
ncbi:hypothetical protein OG21DRAFT_1499912 [Imleria badia]|nr:hypothetical protein OG21DRAFT_1499912 [Imleria badia]